MSDVVMRHEMNDMWWVTWDQDMRCVTWDEWRNDETWAEWHKMSYMWWNMWLTDSDPILSVNSFFWTLW